MKSDQHWHWCFYGKHPAARDYFTIGKNLPMIQAFIDWVERGYLPLTGKKEKAELSNSWRFWSRTPTRNQLICGLVRSSCDAIGRPYPLLMTGVGGLDGWERNWEMLPFACEKVWQQFEHIATRKYTTLERLKLDLDLLKGPDNNWNELRDLISSDHKSGVAGTELTKENMAKLMREKEIFMALKPKTADTLFMLIAKWHQYLKAHCPVMPNALFMGGSMQQTFLAVFIRALKPDDFTLLWDLGALELKHM